MRIKVKHYLWSVIIIFLFLFIRNWNFDLRSLKRNDSIEKIHFTESVTKPYDETSEVTIIFRYTHETSKFLVETVKFFVSKFPLSPVIIVSDTLIPREISNDFSNLTSVTNLPLKLDLLNLIPDRTVVNHIKTKYTFISPVGVFSLLPQEIKSLIRICGRNKTEIIAIPVEKETLKCLQLKINLIQWTIQYKIKGLSLECDSIQGNHGIFFETVLLYKIGEPFMLPFPEAFYLQTAIIKITVVPVHKMKLISKYKETRKKDLNMKNQIQRQLMNKQFKIKKVIRENGVVEWYGCSRNTQRCFPSVVNSVPEYINQNRWTPPCCLKVLRQTVHHVFKVLEKYNIRFWLEGGSLLGAMRGKDIIPWDYDVDVGAYLEDLPKCPWLKTVIGKKTEKNKLAFVVDDEGFVWEKADPEEGEFFRVQASVHNRLHVDIFPFYSKDGVMTKKTWFSSHPQDIEFPESYLKPLTTIEFAGIIAPAPNNIKEFLELKFGRGCVEKPQYPNPKLFPFPENARQLIFNETFTYNVSINVP